jgi:hypothetical protein
MKGGDKGNRRISTIRKIYLANMFGKHVTNEMNYPLRRTIKMKKFFILALILALAVGTAYAADEKFKTSGEYRMEMTNIDNADYNSDADDQKQYVDQRFRVQADFMPADGVKAVWRADFAETTWGTVDTSSPAPHNVSGIGYRPNHGKDTIMVDKAYVDLTKEMINVKAGLWGTSGLGQGLTTDDQATQIEVTANFEPVTVVATWRKISEGSSLVDEEDAQKDTDLYGGEVKFAAEAFSAGVLYATRNDQATEDVKNVIGAWGSMSFGKVNLWAELDSYSGDDGADTDYVGMNLTIAGDTALTEQIKLNFNLHYAPGTTSDNEEQITYLTDDAAYLPLDQGPFAWIWAGTGLDPHMVDYNTGATSFDVYVNYAVMDKLGLFGLVAYLMPNEEDPDDDDNHIDSVTIFTLGATYALLPNTSFGLQYTTASRSVTNDGPAASQKGEDAEQLMGALLKVKF